MTACYICDAADARYVGTDMESDTMESHWACEKCYPRPVFVPTDAWTDMPIQISTTGSPRLVDAHVLGIWAWHEEPMRDVYTDPVTREEHSVPAAPEYHVTHCPTGIKAHSFRSAADAAWLVEDLNEAWSRWKFDGVVLGRADVDADVAELAEWMKAWKQRFFAGAKRKAAK